MKKDIESMGYKQLVLKCYQESALKAVMKAMQNGCSCEVLIENSPVGDKGANGEAERAVGRAIEGTRAVTICVRIWASLVGRCTHNVLLHTEHH